MLVAALPTHPQAGTDTLPAKVSTVGAMATVGSDKHELRAAMLAARAARPQRDQDRAAVGFAEQALTVGAVNKGPTVAAFLAQSGEPGTDPLIDALRSRGVTVLLPVLLEDFDLDWGAYEPGRQAAGRFGLLVPTTRRLGVDAIASVSAIVCPGVAVDLAGNRLGRGGGSYDRALARCGPSVLRCQLAYDDEVLDAVPIASHDQTVDVIVTPTRTIRTSPLR